MKDIYNKLNTTKKLAIFALLLGFGSLLIGAPPDNTTATVNTKELVIMAAGSNDVINVRTLAEWIIEGKSDYRLVDIRTPEEYQEYFIPTAENIPMVELPESGLMKNENIVLYCSNDISTSQAWFLLKSLGYKGVTMVKDGISAWKSEVLFPVIETEGTVEEMREYDKRKEIAAFFGGKAKTQNGTSLESTTDEMPTIEMPQTGTVTQKPKKKKREGC